MTDDGGPETMSVRIAVGVVNLYSSFTASVFLQLKKQLRPGESLVHSVTEYQDDCDLARQRLLRMLAGKSRPAALIAICLKPGPAVIEAYRRAGAPVIVVDEEAEGASTVAADSFAIGRMAGEHLLGAGRRSIAVVSARSHFDGGYSALHRQRGLRQALADAGLELPYEDILEVADYSQQDGVTSMNALLDRNRRIDGVFCAAGDTTAAGMLLAARARGARVPDDVAILSCDDLPVASITDPPLSSIRQPLDDIAREAHRLAVDEPAEILARPRQVLLPPTLIRRQSA